MVTDNLVLIQDETLALWHLKVLFHWIDLLNFTKGISRQIILTAMGIVVLEQHPLVQTKTITILQWPNVMHVCSLIMNGITITLLCTVITVDGWKHPRFGMLLNYI